MSVYIDRDDLIEWIWREKMGSRQAIEEFIKSRPAADVSEIRCGNWSDISGQAVLCSVCGMPKNAKQARGWRYCPHCGAVMECDI